MTLSKPQLRLLRQAHRDAPWVKGPQRRTAAVLKFLGLVVLSESPLRDEVRVHLTEAGRRTLEEWTGPNS